jgi:site-specific DNA-methyltransferase (cytosine-N4-specific)
MEDLLRRQSYNSGPRPSEHHISEESFLTNNGGAIPSSVLRISNTRAQDPYLAYCRTTGLEHHPARMPIVLASFFLRYLTDEKDLVYDPFAGSNTTGAAAEFLNRRWLSTEPHEAFVFGSKARFAGKEELVKATS